jgi:hypothetical protein
MHANVLGAAAGAADSPRRTPIAHAGQDPATFWDTVANALEALDDRVDASFTVSRHLGRDLLNRRLAADAATLASSGRGPVSKFSAR